MSSSEHENVDAVCRIACAGFVYQLRDGMDAWIFSEYKHDIVVNLAAQVGRAAV